MTFQLLGILSAAALAAASVATPGETRSAQSLPVQNLALAQVPAGSSGKLNPVRHLTDADGDQSDEGKCKRDLGHWDEKHRRCRRGGGWFDDGARLLILTATGVGIGFAVSESDHHSVSN